MKYFFSLLFIFMTLNLYAVDDSTIVRLIRLSIKNDLSISSYAKEITISSDDGRVILSGDVASPSERMQIENMASHIEGVKTVSNRLTIRK